MKNLEKYKNDLEKNMDKGELLLYSFEYIYFPKTIKDKKVLEKLPNFYEKYQEWYSEALVLIKQLLSDRLDDF